MKKWSEKSHEEKAKFYDRAFNVFMSISLILSVVCFILAIAN